MPLTLDMHANGETVGVHRGVTIELVLPSNPSTGYQWRLVGSGAAVRLVSHRYEPPAKQIPGRGGREVWRFVAHARGVVALSLGYLRPWLPKEIARRFRVTIRVT